MTGLAERFVLVQGPAPFKAAFLGRWLAAAADIDAITNELLDSSDPDSHGSHAEFDRNAFGLAAVYFVRSFMERLSWFSVSTQSGQMEAFAIMKELGFFLRTGDVYQM